MTTRRLTFALALAACWALPAAAQTPAAVRLVVGYAAGGPVDAAARQFAPQLARELGTTVIVENRPGASGSLAAAAVTSAVPDGQTLFFAASPTLTINPNIYRKLPFDPAALTPIAPLLTYANVLVVNTESPVRSVRDLMAQAASQPGKLSYGSAGTGSSNHLSGELLAAQSKTKLLHVPYKGNAPAMNDLLGGQISMMFDIVGSARPQIAGGRIRALAVTSRERNASLPDVPTMRESGLPKFEVIGWFGLYGPPKLQPALALKLGDAARKAIGSEELKPLWNEQGYERWNGTAETLATQARKDRAMWSTVTKGIELE
jgi:tripartite-type tricarboxylate transporter receptor subunit TctC